VPILLGSFLLTAHLTDAPRLYGIVMVVVAFSLIVQGSLVPGLASVLQVPMRAVQPEPWAMGVRLREQPEGVVRLRVAAGSTVDGRTTSDLDELPDSPWISVVVRHGRLVPVNRGTTLHAGDDTIVLAEPDLGDKLRMMSEAPQDRPESPALLLRGDPCTCTPASRRVAGPGQEVPLSAPRRWSHRVGCWLQICTQIGEPGRNRRQETSLVAGCAQNLLRGRAGLTGP
jgi:uncharacterized protein with PhoU and TrkA domain